MASVERRRGRAAGRAARGAGAGDVAAVSAVVSGAVADGAGDGVSFGFGIVACLRIQERIEREDGGPYSHRCTELTIEPAHFPGRDLFKFGRIDGPNAALRVRKEHGPCDFAQGDSDSVQGRPIWMMFFTFTVSCGGR